MRRFTIGGLAVEKGWIPPRGNVLFHITGEAYRKFCENPYHPFRILPRALIRAEAESGRYYLRYMDAPTEEDVLFKRPR